MKFGSNCAAVSKIPQIRRGRTANLNRTSRTLPKDARITPDTASSPANKPVDHPLIFGTCPLIRGSSKLIYSTMNACTLCVNPDLKCGRLNVEPCETVMILSVVWGSIKVCMLLAGLPATGKNEPGFTNRGCVTWTKRWRLLSEIYDC